MKEEADNVTYAYEPDHSLRKLIGENVVLSHILTPERIRTCQDMLDGERNQFFESAKIDLHKLELLVAKIPLPSHKDDLFFDFVAHYAGNIKGQAELFGFPLISSLTAYMVNYASAMDDPAPKRRSLIVTLVEALKLAFKEKITDEGGASGQELLACLKQLQ